MVAQTTSGLSNEVMTYYSSKFIERSQHSLVHREGFQKSTHGKQKGNIVRLNRYAALSSATTPLTEGSNPAEVNISSSTVDATLAEYGNTVKVAKLLALTSIDKDGAEKSELLGQNMGETLDELARDELFSGATAQLASGAAALSDLAVTDTFDYDEVRKAVRTLEVNKALKYSDGFFVGKVGPFTKYDLTGDSTWINAHTYSDTKELYRGEIGELAGTRFVLTTNQKSESSTVTVYSNFIHGDKSIGEYDLEGDMPKLYVKVPNANDTSNPADRFSVMSWAGAYVAKTMVADWIINVKTGATA